MAIYAKLRVILAKLESLKYAPDASTPVKHAQTKSTSAHRATPTLVLSCTTVSALLPVLINSTKIP